MALQSSGEISINNINVELTRAGTTTASLGETAFRNLAGIASGAISMSNFYGKEFWVYRTGNLALMTSNSSPAPFTAQDWLGNGNAWQSFDQTDFDGSGTKDQLPSWWQLNFGQYIKVVSYDGLFRTAGGSNYTASVQLYNGSSWVTVHSFGWNDPGWFSNTLSGGNIFPATAIRINVGSENGGVLRYMAMFKITAWYSVN